MGAYGTLLNIKMILIYHHTVVGTCTKKICKINIIQLLFDNNQDLSEFLIVEQTRSRFFKFKECKCSQICVVSA